MAENLPLELITEILAKLPVKSLHRFKCVSKTWNSIITSSQFIKHHLHQTLISNTNNIVISNESTLSSAISAVKLRFDIVNYPLNNIPHCPPIKIAGSVHGVLLIVDSSNKTLCLFNPSNKTHRLVPPAPSHEPACDGVDIAEVLGFGYDSVTDDYKVVRVVQLADSEGSGLFTETCVYSMRNDSWESVYDDTIPHTFRPNSAVAVEEILWSVASSRVPKLVFKCYDLRTSTFSLVDFLDLDRYDSDEMVVSWRNLRGCLCVFLIHQMHKVDPANFMGDPLFNREFLYADVWALKDFKWVKLFRIQNNEINKDCMYLRVVTYSKDGKSVLLEVDNTWLGWYDLVTKRVETVPVQGLGAEDSHYLADTYVESLVSVVNNKVVSKKEGTSRPKKTIKKNDFLSSGFKLKL